MPISFVEHTDTKGQEENYESSYDQRGQYAVGLPTVCWVNVLKDFVMAIQVGRGTSAGRP